VQPAHDGFNQLLSVRIFGARIVTTKAVPLFPLQTVLFPGGPLPLRIFEPRYLDMISRCMKEGEPFGVVMLSDGLEAGGQQQIETANTGTLATICDWDQGNDGLLGITALGVDRFRLLATQRQDDGLNVAEIDILQPEPVISLPSQYKLMADLLRVVIDDLGRLYETVEKHYDDASWVGFRFAEILPSDLASKQYCLELKSAVARLEYLQPLLHQFRKEQT
jgi:Lon protease-like protein